MNKPINIFIFLLLSMASIAQENNALLCSDGIDNDGDGEIDCEDTECMLIPNMGCATCFNLGLSFADVVLDAELNCFDNSHSDPSTTIGTSDFLNTSEQTFVSLGENGSISLGFTDNLLVNSGNNNPDLWVFEIGPQVEATQIDLRPFDSESITIIESFGISDNDGDGYYPFGFVSGATSAIDIDQTIGGLNFGSLKFDAVKIIDAEGTCNVTHTNPGADIDAICALSSIEVDCFGELGGTAILDECGICLEPDDPEFNACFECNVFIPNAFSPNQDEINEVFKIYNGPNTFGLIESFQIYDRWGEMLYSKENIEFSSTDDWWNGRYKNELLNPGVYAYHIVINFDFVGEKKYTGSVTLLR